MDGDDLSIWARVVSGLRPKKVDRSYRKTLSGAEVKRQCQAG